MKTFIIKRTVQLIFLFVFTLIIFSCSKNENTNNPQPLLPSQGFPNKLNTILLLKINYTTYEFEGAKELVVSPEKSTIDSLPIITEYKVPGNFGSVGLYYQTKPDTIFFGTMDWAGEGIIYFPKNFNSVDYFELLDTEVPIPIKSKFQLINYNPLFMSQIIIDYNSIWKAVSKIKIVDEYVLSNKKIGLFLYTSGMGVGYSAKWNWILILDN